MKDNFIRVIYESIYYILFGLIVLCIVTYYAGLALNANYTINIYKGYIIFHILNMLSVVVSIWYSVFNLCNLDDEHYTSYITKYKLNFSKNINDMQFNCFVTFLLTIISGSILTTYVIYVH